MLGFPFFIYKQSRSTAILSVSKKERSTKGESGEREMIPLPPGASSCFPTVAQGLQMYGGAGHEDIGVVASTSVDNNAAASASAADTHSNSLLYSLSLLKEKVHQVQSLISVLVSPPQIAGQSAATASMAVASIVTTIQELVAAASSMMFTCQQMSNASTSSADNATSHQELIQQQQQQQQQQQHRVKPVGHHGGLLSHHHSQPAGIYASDQTFDWFADNSYVGSPAMGNNNSGNSNSNDGSRAGQNGRDQALPRPCGGQRGHNEGSSLGTSLKSGSSNFDIIEVDASELLAKYTHYCQICGKGFKRDANLRMHMRAHGDEYKTSSALSNPLKNSSLSGAAAAAAAEECPTKMPRKYSCPHQGCRWNQKHAKFQPLKSMVCVKNHYKRSHCPKMYVCKRCNRKQFSVLSDLRTHEKHCGDLKWQCSCGTTFSRKDKLMGHVALFVGHLPLINLTKPEKAEGQSAATSMKIDDR